MKKVHLDKENHKPQTSLFQSMVQLGSCLGKLMPLLSSLKLHKTEALSLPCTFTPLCRSTAMFKINQGEDLALFTWLAISGKNNICCSATSTTITSSTQKGLHADCEAQTVPSNVMSGVSCYFSSQMCISSTPGAPPGALLLIQNTKNSTWAQTCTAEERMGELWKNLTLPVLSCKANSFSAHQMGLGIKSKAMCVCASTLRQPMLSSPSRASPGSQLNFWNSCRPKTPANQTSAAPSPPIQCHQHNTHVSKRSVDPMEDT